MQRLNGVELLDLLDKSYETKDLSIDIVDTTTNVLVELPSGLKPISARDTNEIDHYHHTLWLAGKTVNGQPASEEFLTRQYFNFDEDLIRRGQKTFVATIVTVTKTFAGGSVTEQYIYETTNVPATRRIKYLRNQDGLPILGTHYSIVYEDLPEPKFVEPLSA